MRPDSAWAMHDGKASNMMSMFPPIRLVMAGALPFERHVRHLEAHLAGGVLARQVGDVAAAGRAHGQLAGLALAQLAQGLHVGGAQVLARHQQERRLAHAGDGTKSLAGS